MVIEEYDTMLLGDLDYCLDNAQKGGKCLFVSTPSSGDNIWYHLYESLENNSTYTSTCSSSADSTDIDCYELVTLTINGASGSTVVIDDIAVSLIENHPTPCIFEEEVVYDVYWEFLDDIEYKFKVLYARNKSYIRNFFLPIRSLYVRRLMCDRSGYIPYRRRRRM